MDRLGILNPIKVGLITFALLFFPTASSHAELNLATTTVFISICGDALINAGEECDVPGETGVYSTTIIGRQCGTNCKFGPYCGDGILQTIYGEQCDDANNTDGDYCSADCTHETADNGGGSTGGGGSSSSGGRDSKLGDTQVSIQGKAFPNATVNILMDAVSVGTVRTNGKGEFQFNTQADPGTTSFSFWATDNSGTKSMTVNTTFDVTQGAVTSLNGILIPPTLKLSATKINPGDTVTLQGQTVPSATVEIAVDSNTKVYSTTADSLGGWTFSLNTSGMSASAHTIKARFISGEGVQKSESMYGTASSLFVGVDGKVTSNSDLNRDGKVNLIDFSILIFWWGTPGGNSNPPADINQNGKVGLEDFSILLFNWTG